MLAMGSGAAPPCNTLDRARFPLAVIRIPLPGRALHLYGVLSTGPGRFRWPRTHDLLRSLPPNTIPRTLVRARRQLVRAGLLVELGGGWWRLSLPESQPALWEPRDARAMEPALA